MADDNLEDEDLEDSDEPDAENDSDRFILGPADLCIVRSARDLLWKLARSSLILPRELFSVAKVLHSLERLPRMTRVGEVSISLGGPRKWFGEREIWHWWTVSTEGESLSITSGGHFYTEASGGDTFTCMRWIAAPGSEPEYADYLDSLRIVDDAQPFDVEVGQLDLTQPGYSIDLYDDENELEDDYDDEPKDDQDAGR